MRDEWNEMENQYLQNELKLKLTIPIIIFGTNFSIDKRKINQLSIDKKRDSETSFSDMDIEKLVSA